MVKFLSCFGEKQKTALDEENLIEGQKPGCVFCGVTREKGFDIIEEVRIPLVLDRNEPIL